MQTLAAPTLLAFKELASAEHMRLYGIMAAAQAAGGDSWDEWLARWQAAARICGWGCAPGGLQLEQWGGQYVFLQLLPVARALLRSLAGRGFGSGGQGSAGFAADAACEALARLGVLSFQSCTQGGEPRPRALLVQLEAAALSTAGLHSVLAAWEAEGCSGRPPGQASDVFALLTVATAAFAECPGRELATDAALAAAEAAVRLAAALLQLGQRRQQLFALWGRPLGPTLVLLMSFATDLLEAARGCPPTRARERAATCAAASAAKLCLVVSGLPASQQLSLSACFQHCLKDGLSLLLASAAHVAVSYALSARAGHEHGPAAAAPGGDSGEATGAGGAAGTR